MRLKITWSITQHLTNQKPTVINAVGLITNPLKIMKTFKKLIKFLTVVTGPSVALFFYVYYIQEIFSLDIAYIILCHVLLLVVFFNAVFYSYHMSNTKIFDRFTLSIVPAFGLLVGHDNSGSIQILIACVGIDFNYKNLFTEEKPKLF